MKTNLRWLYIVLIPLVALAAACSGATTPSSTITATPTSSPSASVYSQYQLSYLLLAKYPDYFWCDPDFYPIAREGAEQANALQQFPSIQTNTAEFSAIVTHLGIASQTVFSDQDKLNIYREHKKITLVAPLTFSGNLYTFSLRIGSGQGKTLSGTITQSGVINIQSQQNSVNSCPICLSRGTLISTPQGPIQVELLTAGTPVWTQDSRGNRLSEPLLRVSKTAVPIPFSILKLTLSDGRTITASPMHPTVTGRTLTELRVGDILDNAQVASIEAIVYTVGATYDLLPSGPTGFYWANDILLASTLKP